MIWLKNSCEQAICFEMGDGKNYPSIEIIIHLSDLFGITIDELLRSDEELTQKVIEDSKQLAYQNGRYF